MVQCLVFRVFGLRVLGIGRLKALGLRGLEFLVLGLKCHWFWVWAFGLGVQACGFRVLGSKALSCCGLRGMGSWEGCFSCSDHRNGILDSKP